MTFVAISIGVAAISIGVAVILIFFCHYVAFLIKHIR